MLNLSDALKLYDLIGQYLPDIISDDPLDYIDDILSNMELDNNNDDYTKIVQLLSGKSLDDLLVMSGDEIISLVLLGLIENKVTNLRAFCENMNYG